MAGKLRVVQWATGSMGKTCLRAVLDSPNCELVGLFVYNPAKAGVDAGEIARRPAAGVLATSSIDDILALDADVVLHCPMLASPYDGHDADVKRLLESGKNVISINNYFHPWALGEAYAQGLEASAHKGGATLAGVGVNPGWVAEKVAAAVAGIALRLDHVATTSTALASPTPPMCSGHSAWAPIPRDWTSRKVRSPAPSPTCTPSRSRPWPRSWGSNWTPSRPTMR